MRRKLVTLAQGVENAIIKMSKGLNIIGPIGVAALMLLVAADVIMRFFFNSPIPGTLHISEYVLVTAVYCGVAYCAVVKGHVKFDLLILKIPVKVRLIVDSITSLICLGVIFILVWSSVLTFKHSWTSGEVSLDNLQVPAWPFRGAVVIGVSMLCLVLFIEFAHIVIKVVKR